MRRCLPLARRSRRRHLGRSSPRARPSRGWAALLVVLFMVGCVGGVSCGGQSEVPAGGLSPQQIQFSSFWPRDYVLDLRAEGSSPAAGDRRSGAVQLGEGWSEADSDGRWALGERSTVLVHIASRTDLNLFFEYRSPGVEAISVRVNGSEVGELPTESTWHSEAIPLADGVLRPGLNTIELHYVAGPSGFPLQSEAGSLSVYFRTVGVVASDEPVETEGEGPALGRTETALTIGQPGTLLIPFRSDRPLAGASIGVSGQARWWGRPRLWARFKAAAADDAGPESNSAVEARLGGLWGRALASAELGLDGQSGPGCFVVDVDVDPNGSPLQLETLQVDESPPPLSSDPAGLPELPDVVLIILDAARADHFGAYGYSRETTPNIDELATESFVFDQVMATAPYTLSSMATMLSGLSFTQHGVVERGHRLADSVMTLAESFQEAGYHTSCLSANPNNSIALGLDQGCEVFEEFWRGVRPPLSLDPYRVSRRALDELARQGNRDEPLFLMLHYVPPHEPYTPLPEFDVFGADDYQGTYDGGLATMLGIERGELQPTAADLAEVMSLYDGNLRMGDDAVGHVLEALRQRERWNQTVVLVTSDHGEAFYEHGRMGHNSTVYDEMLHVPFILRVPGTSALRVDVSSLASLADVTPTLLGIAGIESRSRLYGQNLLAPRATGRRVVSRTGGPRPFVSYRTERWKAIRGPRDTRQLFDLSTDPFEENNLFLEGYETFACLDALLRWELSGAVDGSAEGGERELSEEDIRTLRSLGYIR